VRAALQEGEHLAVSRHGNWQSLPPCAGHPARHANDTPCDSPEPFLQASCGRDLLDGRALAPVWPQAHLRILKGRRNYLCLHR